MQSCKNIVLIGMPGCGKTTLGKRLADKMGYAFLDIDKLIEEKFGTISDLFQKGEKHFRKKETQAVEIVSQMEKTIIATGGGVVLDDYNIELLAQNGIIIFIDRPLDDIIGDIDCVGRPLIEEGKDEIVKLFNKRYSLYRVYADIIIKNNATQDKALDNMMSALKEIM